MDKIAIAVGVMLSGLVLLVFFIVFVKYFNLWLQAWFTGAKVSMLALIAMSFRKVNARVIVESKIMAAQAGLPDISTNAFEAHFLAQGNVRRVVQALIVAHRAKIDLDWETATAMNLAGEGGPSAAARVGAGDDPGLNAGPHGVENIAAGEGDRASRLPAEVEPGAEG